MRRHAVTMTRHLAHRRALSFLNPAFTSACANALHAPSGARAFASDDETPRATKTSSSAKTSSGGSSSSSWNNRVHKCRFAEHDVQVMHSDTNRGIEVLLNPIYNKGTGFSIAEKERLGIRGLTPPRYFSIEEQCAKIWENMNEPGKTAMFKWRSMQALQDRNETLFYRLLVDHIEAEM